MYLFLTVFALFFANLTELQAQDLPSCTGFESSGTTCLISPLKIHPTQFAVGLREVHEKANQLAQKSNKKLAKYLDAHPAPGVIGPNHQLYITDRQHLASALAQAGLDEIEISVTQDLSNLSVDAFWTQMKAQNLCFLYDENGNGPLDPSLLPSSVTEMKDDPYRSLAHSIRKEGGYDDTGMNFLDSYWANFFRSRVEIGTSDDDYAAAVEAGLTLAHSPEASALPGYSPEN